MRLAVFFDRDGVVNELVPDPDSGLPESPLHPDDVALVPGASSALLRLQEGGYVLVGISNQPAAAKGTVPLGQLERVQQRVVALLDEEGFTPDAFRLCFHHPEGVVPALSRICDCRKPAPGMVLEAAAELELDLSRSWLVGDTDDDVTAGTRAGCATVLVEHPGSAHKRRGGASATEHAPDLNAAADLILRCSR